MPPTNAYYLFLLPVEYRRLFDRVVSLTHLNLHRLELGSESWAMQFRQAMSVNGGDVENAKTVDYIMHFCTFAWKVRLRCFFNPSNLQHHTANSPFLLPHITHSRDGENSCW